MTSSEESSTESRSMTSSDGSNTESSVTYGEELNAEDSRIFSSERCIQPLHVSTPNTQSSISKTYPGGYHQQVDVYGAQAGLDYCMMALQRGESNGRQLTFLISRIENMEKEIQFETHCYHSDGNMIKTPTETVNRNTTTVNSQSQPQPQPRPQSQPQPQPQPVSTEDGRM